MAGPDRSPSGPKSSGHRVLFEFTQLGQQVRVAAIDEATGTEVVVIAPLGLRQPQMQQLALARLKRKLEGHEEPQPPPIRPGKWA